MSAQSERPAVKRTMALLRDAWMILGITLVLFVSVEAMLRVAFLARDRIRGHSTAVAGRYIVWQKGLADCAWKDEYAREWDQSHRTRWSSYVYWRRQPHSGQCINIDQDGLRKTWNSDRKPQGSAAPVNIFMFGGSAVWGTGVRDDFTIPSLLAKELDERGVACRMTNFGEAGYVTTQEIILLIRQLQKGNIPDLVVFYDGVNDTYSAWQQQTAGLPQNEFNRVREFNLSQSGSYRSLRGLFLHATTRELATTRFLEGLGCRLGLMGPPGGGRITRARSGNCGDESESLCHEVLAVYRSNLAIVETLGQQYGFRVLFYWQPTIFDKNYRTAYEESHWQANAALQPFFGGTCGQMRREGLSAASDGAFHDLTGVFAEVREGVFLDWCHLSESGNHRIARKIATDIPAALGLHGRQGQRGPASGLPSSM